MKDLNIQFKYEFESCLGDIEGFRYIQDIKGYIVNTDEKGHEQVIGESLIKMLLLEHAVEDDFDIYDVFDSYEYTMRIGSMIYDFDYNEIKLGLQKKLFGTYDAMRNSNICIFERMAILPEYRGLGLGAKFVKDKFINFSSSCGLIVMQPFPLQLERREHGPADDFEKGMDYASMEQDDKKATKSLKAFYKKIGYISVRGYENLMFLLPGVDNKKLDAIDMNTPTII